VKFPIVVILSSLPAFVIADSISIETSSADPMAIDPVTFDSRCVDSTDRSPNYAAQHSLHRHDHTFLRRRGLVLSQSEISSHATQTPTELIVSSGDKPPISLASRYSSEITLSDFLISEKYDGARAWWNGHHLLSRGGNIYHAPAWFTNAMPNVVLDGELWIGRGQFQRLMKTIRDTKPDEKAWRSVRFMVFDAPMIKGGFSQRQKELQNILATHRSSWVETVVQHNLKSAAQLQQMLLDVTGQGGEGLILQRADMPYFPGRHSGFLKHKPYQDAEAVVTGYTSGKGKYTGMTGSLIVVDSQGRQFKLGSGLSDADRKSPPPIGTRVTYRHQGRTASGKPRFARYLRVRLEE